MGNSKKKIMSGLAKRLIVHILLFSSFITLIGTSLQLYLDYAQDMNQIDEAMVQIETSYQQSIINSLWVSDFEHLEVQLLGILDLPDMQYLNITREGETIISVGDSPRNKFVTNSFQLSYPFKGQTIDLGILHVYANLDNVYRRLYDKVLIILATQTIKTFLVSSFIFFLFYVLIGKHLTKLARYTQKLTFDNLDETISLDRKKTIDSPPDELDIVITAINDMRLNLIRDVESRKQAEAEKDELEEKLRQSHKMEAIGTMAGGIAHDFNNILAIIIGNAEIAIDDIPAGNPARENIAEIQKASNRARELVSQILAFSRKEQKELISIRPQSIINETLKLVRSTTPTTVSIIQSISQDCGKIKADPTSLHQLLMNLFTNAVHSMDEKGEVTVSLQEVNLESDELDQLTATAKFFSVKTPGIYARLSVTDKGTGMDEEAAARIFDPFYTTKEVGKGTGMGLSVVHGIVKSHGGFIDFDSEPGRGSAFHVFFPITEEEDEESVEAETTPLQTGTARILLIDDEESLLMLGKRILDKLGYEVTAENSSVKALEIFKSDPHQFDLIITDQAMPNMSGTELVAEIVKVRPDVPLILCTGFSSKVSEENAKEKGISKFINKPYTQKILAEAVREVLVEKNYV